MGTLLLGLVLAIYDKALAPRFFCKPPDFLV